MVVLQHACVLISLGFVCHGAVLKDGGRNDGEPDYDLGFMDLRDGGRNDGEPDYNPTFLEFRSEDDEDAVQVPDLLMPENVNEFADFKLLSTRSGVLDPKLDIPEIEVTFTNGVKQRMNLKHYNSIPNSETIDHSRLCNYLGHLEGDETESNVAVTGCLMGDNPDEKMYITLLSKHSPLHKTFSLNSNGNVQHIELQSHDEFVDAVSSKDTKRDMNGWHNIGGDAKMNDNIEAASAAINVQEMNTVPAKLKLKFRLGYDLGTKNGLASLGKNVDNWLAEVMTHAQNHYMHSTLKNKIIFENTQQTLFLNKELACPNGRNDVIAEVRRLNEPDVDLYAWINNKGSCTGIAAGIGTACDNTQFRKTSLTRGPSRGVVETAETLVHEMGHNLGMFHDHVDVSPTYSKCRKESDSSQMACSECANYQPGNSGQPIGPVTGHPNDCCNGFMGYFNHPHFWSGCSSRYFEQHYISENWSKCMEPSEVPVTTAQPPTASCNGVPSTDFSCCSVRSPCNVGGGDCDGDSECDGNLSCGNNNCNRDFSSTGSNWHSAADCCIGTVNPTTQPPTQPPTASCNGVPSTDFSCCSSASPCNVGGGDCDDDSECDGNLICGDNNCNIDFSSTGSNWHSAADCCIGTAIPTTQPPTQPPTASCNGVPSTDYRCCSSASPCNVGGGDCDNDSECAGNLSCGKDNCKRDFSSTASNWAANADCCIDAATPPATTNPPAAACGIKPAGIVGGSAVTPYSLPWQVALVGPGSSTPFCGGTLISPRHVMTAAHCMGTRYGTNFEIIVGEHSSTDSSDGTRHTICRAVSHSQYNQPARFSNDFAIVHLQQPVQIGTRASPACLPTANLGGDFLTGKTMTVSGWGRLSSGGSAPTVLHKVDVPGITNDQCKASYSSSSISDDMLCAGDVANGGIDSCQGDSGGPLTYNHGGRTTLVGVVSWGHGCAQAGKPGVYGRVTEVLSWINGELAQTC